MSLSVQSNLFTTANCEIKKNSIVTNDTEDLTKAISGETKNSSNISGEYVDDDNMTGNAKAATKLINLIGGSELFLLELDADFDKVMSLACAKPINAAEFDNAFNDFKDKVEKKRAELGLTGKSDDSPASQINIMLAKMKNGESPQKTLSELLKLRNSANSKTPEGKQIIATVTPYIDGLNALNNKKTVITDKNGKSIDKNEELKKAILDQNTTKINSIITEIDESANREKANSSQKTTFSETFKIANFT